MSRLNSCQRRIHKRDDYLNIQNDLADAHTLYSAIYCIDGDENIKFRNRVRSIRENESLFDATVIRLEQILNTIGYIADEPNNEILAVIKFLITESTNDGLSKIVHTQETCDTLYNMCVRIMDLYPDAINSHNI